MMILDFGWRSSEEPIRLNRHSFQKVEARPGGSIQGIFVGKLTQISESIAPSETTERASDIENLGR